MNLLVLRLLRRVARRIIVASVPALMLVFASAAVASATTVTSVNPNSGPTSGNNTVTVNGSGFTGATQVDFGGTAAPAPPTVLNDNQLTVTAPAGNPGTVDVTVVAPGGTSTPNPPGDQYTYVTPAPTVTSVTPNSGPTGGGTSVTITGTNLSGATAVDFGTNNPATNVQVDPTGTQITATTPAGTPGTYDVIVTTPAGTSQANPPGDQFTYNPPTVTSVSPASGPTAGGTSVTIDGTNLNGATAVDFGTGNPATNVQVNQAGTQITATTPAGNPGTYDVIVTAGGGQSAPNPPGDQFTYVPRPSITSITPTSGSAGGGTSVTINGSGFTNATAVNFGNNSAIVTASSPNQLVVTAPAGSGTVPVTVSTPVGGTSNAATFTYIPVTPPPQTSPPTVNAFIPIVYDAHRAGLTGDINPQGLSTTAYYAYGLDARYQQYGITTYNRFTQHKFVGSDFSSHPLSAALTGLLPNALYHVRLIAVNSDGMTIGSDRTFRTKPAPAPPPPRLGRSVNVKPSHGTVFVLKHGQLVPLTQNSRLATGSVIDALAGQVTVVAASGTRGKTFTGTFGGGIFRITQAASGPNRGLTTLTLLESAFPGSPTYASCPARTAAANGTSSRVVQTLRARARGLFRTRGRFAVATVAGARWTTTDQCDGTSISVQAHAVQVTNRVKHITVLLHTGQRYVALAHPRKTAKKKHK